MFVVQYYALTVLKVNVNNVLTNGQNDNVGGVI